MWHPAPPPHTHSFCLRLNFNHLKTKMSHKTCKISNRNACLWPQANSKYTSKTIVMRWVDKNGWDQIQRPHVSKGSGSSAAHQLFSSLADDQLVMKSNVRVIQLNTESLCRYFNSFYQTTGLLLRFPSVLHGGSSPYQAPLQHLKKHNVNIKFTQLEICLQIFCIFRDYHVFILLPLPGIE